VRTARKAVLFLKKKNQKNFYNHRAMPVSPATPQFQKFFAELFFKKATACFPDF
jgi:hypothetical protein